MFGLDGISKCETSKGRNFCEPKIISCATGLICLLELSTTVSTRVYLSKDSPP